MNKLKKLSWNIDKLILLLSEKFSPQERLIIYLIVTAFFIFVFFILFIRPVSNLLYDSRLNAEFQSKSLYNIENLINENSNKYNKKSIDLTNQRDLIFKAATTNNIQISRIQPFQENGIYLQFNSVMPNDFISFLSYLNTEYGIYIKRINMNKNENGSLSCQITLVPNSE